MTYGVMSCVMSCLLLVCRIPFTFYPSLETICTLGVAVCRFSGVLLILAFKRRFRVVQVFWFIQYGINLHSQAIHNKNISSKFALTGKLIIRTYHPYIQI